MSSFRQRGSLVSEPRTHWPAARRYTCDDRPSLGGSELDRPVRRPSQVLAGGFSPILSRLTRAKNKTWPGPLDERVPRRVHTTSAPRRHVLDSAMFRRTEDDGRDYSVPHIS